jgi:tritrans,polycis-undecaprenyl-diphosphate synthase [geranylgeranyl-diphosphate specific]
VFKNAGLNSLVIGEPVPENDGLHIAIIPDGNRRWARKHGKPIWYGHIAGAKKLHEVAEWCAKHPEIKTVSVYALSTENLTRDSAELNQLWELYKKQFNDLRRSEELRKRGLRVKIIGNSAAWRADVRQAAKDLMVATKNYTRGVLNILLAYGSQFEILNSAKRIAVKGASKMPMVPELFGKFMMVNRPVDLVIRTGGQRRLSNFLLWQAAYAELYFTDVLWPAFSRKEFEKALRWYREQQRKFGK